MSYTAINAKKDADAAAEKTQQALLNVALNAIKQAAAKNLYVVSFNYPKHQAEALKPLLEKDGFKVTITNAGKIISITTVEVDDSNMTLTIDFSAPTE